MKIAKIKGIEINLHLSTLFIIGLVGFYAADFYSSLVPGVSLIELILMGILNGVLIIISVLVHELTHSLIAQRFGLKVSEIELYVFGGVSKIEQEPNTPRSELIISIFGPISSLIIGGILLSILYLIPITLPPLFSVTLLYSGFTNVILGIFNLIPAYPLDGGRVLRAFLWARRHDVLSATKSASSIGNIIAYLLMGYGFLQMLLFDFFSGLWLVIIASFLNNQSRHAYIQTLNEVMLAKITAKEIINVPQIKIPFNMLVIDAIKQYFMIYRKSYFPVVQNNKIVGIVHIEDVRKIPISQRTEIIIGYIMKKISQFPIITETETGKDALVKLTKIKKRPLIIVVQDKNQNIVGFIGEDELVSTINFLTQLP